MLAVPGTGSEEGTAVASMIGVDNPQLTVRLAFLDRPVESNVKELSALGGGGGTQSALVSASPGSASSFRASSRREEMPSFL